MLSVTIEDKMKPYFVANRLKQFLLDLTGGASTQITATGSLVDGGVKITACSKMCSLKAFGKAVSVKLSSRVQSATG